MTSLRKYQSSDLLRNLTQSPFGFFLQMELLALKGVEQDLFSQTQKGMVAEYALRFSFKITNNQVEYEALLVRLKLGKKLRVKSLWVFTDSQLITSQVTGEYKAWKSIMAQHLDKVWTFRSTLKYFRIFYILRWKNAQVDILS